MSKMNFSTTNLVASNYYQITSVLPLNNFPTLMRFAPRKQHVWLRLTTQWKPITSTRFGITASDFKHKRSSSPMLWTAKVKFWSPGYDLLFPRSLVSLHTRRKNYCSRAHLSPGTLRRKQWRASDKGTLAEDILQALKISGIGPKMIIYEHVAASTSRF